MKDCLQEEKELKMRIKNLSDPENQAKPMIACLQEEMEREELCMIDNPDLS